MTLVSGNSCPGVMPALKVVGAKIGLPFKIFLSNQYFHLKYDSAKLAEELHSRLVFRPEDAFAFCPRRIASFPLLLLPRFPDNLLMVYISDLQIQNLQATIFLSKIPRDITLKPPSLVTT